jgi:hypothetical protein
MAKSIRAKTKMAARKKKREVGNYAAADAERVQRLSERLLGKSKAQEGEVKKVDAEEGEGEDVEEEEGDATMEDGGTEGELPHPICWWTKLMGVAAGESKKISTHGSRGSRREAWRVSKGMEPRGKSAGINRQGRMGARSKAGRPKRRR